jgi:hypothetical protein
MELFKVFLVLGKAFNVFTLLRCRRTKCKCGFEVQKKASEACHFNLPKPLSTPTKMSMNYNPQNN